MQGRAVTKAISTQGKEEKASPPTLATVFGKEIMGSSGGSNVAWKT